MTLSPSFSPPAMVLAFRRYQQSGSGVHHRSRLLVWACECKKIFGGGFILEPREPGKFFGQNLGFNLGESLMQLHTLLRCNLARSSWPERKTRTFAGTWIRLLPSSRLSPR